MESRFLFAHLVVKETSGVAGDLLCIPIIEDGAAPGRFFVVEPPPFMMLLWLFLKRQIYLDIFIENVTLI
jgi:hypothetical protein